MHFLPTLFSRAATGALRQWQIEYNYTGFRTHSGQVGGKLTTSEWYIVEATNVGRANARNRAEQAAFEANAKWTKKVEAGYTETPALVDTATSFIEPMLAKNWDDWKNAVAWPVYSQPKLDGMRAIITKDGAKSRNGKTWMTVGHILRALEPLFKEFPDLVLDGELYNHEFKEDFNKISSLAKKTKPQQRDLEEAAEKLQFHWYDCVDSSAKFSVRAVQIKSLCDKYGFNTEKSPVKLVPTLKHQSVDTLDTTYGQYLESGFEGQMVRLDDTYIGERTHRLLKRKEFKDDEFLIVDICEGNGNKCGMAGYAVLETALGQRFNSNIKGKHSFLEDLLKNRAQYVGTYGTCTYFNLTPDGIPRFPYLTRLRAGKSCD